MKNLFLLLFLAAATISCNSKKDIVKVSNDFRIRFVSVSTATVKLECTQGCAWKELSWTRSNGTPQAINAYGMVMVDELNEPVNLKDDLPEFKFIVEPTDNGATLESLNGTAWKKLSFSCLTDCNQIVDYNGLTK
jgi:hypothetical protein